MSSHSNGLNHERTGQKRERDADDMDSECLPISKRINSLSLNTHIQMGGGWPAAGPSQAAPGPAGRPQPALSMPDLLNGTGPAEPPPPRPPPPPPEPDLSPEECPQYFAINSYLYRLHLERLRRHHHRHD